MRKLTPVVKLLEMTAIILFFNLKEMCVVFFMFHYYYYLVKALQYFRNLPFFLRLAK
jgi:hypothetical protein